ncbi:MAG: tetratricopeptide repeat protein, partial [Deltaproteobacteria bacterium]|nr:tetratricopeptide repeat protein [Deltaproteobacteria bacterium]
MKKLVYILLSAIILSDASVTMADDTPSQTDAVAVFKQGVALFDSGDFRGAANAFRQANRLKENWKIQYNIGQSEAAAKRYGLALEAFESYLALGGDEIDIARRDEVLDEIKRMKLRVATLEVSAPPGALVYIDDFLRGAVPLPGPMLISAGVLHVLEIKLDDEVILTQQVKLSNGQTQKISVENRDAPVITDAAAPTDAATVPD